MRTRLITQYSLLLLLFLTSPVRAMENHLLIIVGIGGTEDYRHQFARHAASLKASALASGISQEAIILLGGEAESGLGSDKTTIIQTLRDISHKAGSNDRIFIIMIGHGNPRGDSAVFNITGPDISAEDFAEAINILGNRELVIVNTASSSGPFLRTLSGSNRIVITATSNGREYQATEFGNFFVAAFDTQSADRDKDERISILEAFDYAKREVKRSFENKKRLLTEHALLDDNGDGKGSLSPGERSEDGMHAYHTYLQAPLSASPAVSKQLINLIKQKQEIELSISELKRQRDNMQLASYYQQLETMLVELALLAREIRLQRG